MDDINVINRKDVFSKYHHGHERTGSINSIVIHGSAGGQSAELLFKWWSEIDTKKGEWNIEKTKKLKKGIGFYHYLIDLDGKIYYMLDENKWAYHSHSGAADRSAIAICLLNTGVKNSDNYTDNQYHSLYQLIENIGQRILSITKIEGHSNRAKKYSRLETATPCPGPNFEWERLYIHAKKIHA